ncbi:MAG TPA: sugar transferase [Nitriliruptorales bacterium]|nr:sugar transferase [Nitriliruptorales bacterium]
MPPTDNASHAMLQPAAAPMRYGAAAVPSVTLDPRGPDSTIVLADPPQFGGLALAGGWAAATKRLIDVVGSLVLLVVLTPLLLAIALTVKVSSRGPLLYRQRRVGYHGRTFELLKFRSMYADAEARRAEVAVLNECTGPVFKIRNDPRITRVGRMLRKFSLDELPQLVNVLRGEMSLVGPRPATPEEVETYGHRERQRLLVRPGVTCIWQVSGRSDVDFDTWMEMDLAYIETWSLWRDVVLLVRTIPAVLSCRGAY